VKGKVLMRAEAGDRTASCRGRLAYALVWACAPAAVAVALSCTSAPEGPSAQTYARPEDAVRALTAAVEAGNLEQVRAIFGAEGRELVDSADPATARRNREVFTAAVAEKWQLVDNGTNGKTLVIGNEAWPFPVPLVKDANGWRFDAAAGKEEVLSRRIGRNELAAIRICRTYVTAQRLYAQHGHDGKRAGLYARSIRSDPGRQNGLYWPATRGQKRSPLGDLVAQAAAEGQAPGADRQKPMPFYGYYFKMLTAQGAAAGGAKDYVVDGELSGGFALVAWPAQYDATGVMTFLVNHEGIVREKNLGPATDQAARNMALYNPDGSWGIAQ
jgi:hypothetical protein